MFGIKKTYFVGFGIIMHALISMYNNPESINSGIEEFLIGIGVLTGRQAISKLENK